MDLILGLAVGLLPLFVVLTILVLTVLYSLGWLLLAVLVSVGWVGQWLLRRMSRVVHNA